MGTIITNEGDLAFLEAVAARGPVALDAQGCLRQQVGDELVTAGWPWADQALPLVHYLKVDDREALALTGEWDHHRAAEKLAAYGPKEIVLTRQEGVPSRPLKRPGGLGPTRTRTGLWGIVPGGAYEDLRRASARTITGMDFPGAAIGGSLGRLKEDMRRVLEWCGEELPADQLKHLLGIGTVEDTSWPCSTG